MINVINYSSVICRTKEIVSKELEDNSKPIYFVVPEFSKAQIEREIISELTNSSDNNVCVFNNDERILVGSSFTDGDILSFITLASKIIERSGVSLGGSANDILLRNAIYSILVNHNSEFDSFRKLVNKFDYVNMLIHLLGDFTRYNIDSNQIKLAIEKANLSDKGDEEYIKKLKDIALLMDYISEINIKYNLKLLSDPIGIANEILKNLLADGKSKSSRMNRQLIKFLEGRFVFIGFGSVRKLTPKENELVCLLSELGSEVNLYAIYPEDNNNVETLYESGKEFTDFFRNKNASITKLDDINEKSDVSRIVEKYSHNELSNENGFITKDIKLSEIKGIDDRLGYIFHEIINLTRQENYRYKDIRIVCCDEDMIGRLRSVAEMYGLDIFIDRKILLSNTAVPFFTQVLLELPRTNYSLDIILKALRSGMLRIPPYVCDMFDNYCHKHNIVDASSIFDKYSYKSYKDESVYIFENTIIKNSKEGSLSEGNYPAGEFFWNYVVKRVLIPLKEKADSIYEAKTLSLKASLLMDYLGGIRLYISSLRDELSSANMTDEAVSLVRGYDEMMELLANFTHEMNDVEISQKGFISLIRTDMRNKTEGTIPLKVDSVEITTPERAFVAPCKVLFIVGAKRDNFPYKKSSEGLLSGPELDKLSKSISVELPDKRKLETRQEFATACLTLGTVSDKLYMVHEFGEAKSRVHEFMEKFVSVSDIGVNNYTTPIYGKEVERRYDFKNASIPEDVVNELIGDKFSVSVSGLEKYNECHMKFMLERLLKIKQREDNTNIKTNKMGSLIHKMMEIGVKKCVEIYDTPEKLIELSSMLKENSDVLDKLSDSILIESMTSDEKIEGSIDSEGNVKEEYLINPGIKLKRVFEYMFPDIIRDCGEKRYMPSEFEASIKDGEELNISYQVGNKTFSFTGFIDRIDTSFDDPDVFRIEDYKSGSKKIDMKKLIEGVQIQLPAYAGAIINSRPNMKLGNYGYSLTGLSATDKENIFSPSDSTYSREELDYSVKYAQHIIEKNCNEISEGKAEALAYGKESCSYCKFNGLCGNVASDPVSRQHLINQFDNDEDIKKIMDSDLKAGEKTKLKNIAVIKKSLGEE